MEVYRSLRPDRSKDKKKNDTDKVKKKQIRLIERFVEADQKRKKGGKRNGDKKYVAKKTNARADKGKKNRESTEVDNIKTAKDRKRKRVKEFKNIAELIEAREAKERKKLQKELSKKNSGAKILDELLSEDKDFQLGSLQAPSWTSKRDQLIQKTSQKDVKIVKAYLLAKNSMRRAELWKKKYYRLKNKLQAVA